MHKNAIKNVANHVKLYCKKKIKFGRFDVV